MIELNITTLGIEKLTPAIEGSFQRIAGVEGRVLQSELTRKSYQGATGELKAGWRIKKERRQVTVFHQDSKAIFKIRGRGPGKAPPLNQIKLWVAYKLSKQEAKKKAKERLSPQSKEKAIESSARRVQKTIAQKGTLRWRSGENFLKIDKFGNLGNDSPIRRAEAKILKALKKIKL